LILTRYISWARNNVKVTRVFVHHEIKILSVVIVVGSNDSAFCFTLTAVVRAGAEETAFRCVDK
jgi:hypothetical protein